MSEPITCGECEWFESCPNDHCYYGWCREMEEPVAENDIWLDCSVNRRDIYDECGPDADDLRDMRDGD